MRRSLRRSKGPRSNTNAAHRERVVLMANKYRDIGFLDHQGVDRSRRAPLGVYIYHTSSQTPHMQACIRTQTRRSMFSFTPNAAGTHLRHRRGHHKKYSFLPGRLGGTQRISSLTALKSLKLRSRFSLTSMTLAILPQR